MLDAKQKTADSLLVEEDAETLLDFPCDFPIKAMGEAGAGFEALVCGIVGRHDPGFSQERLGRRMSANGKYLALTCTVRATSKAMLDALYQELSAHPQIRYVL